jgi:hemolysin III
MEFFNVISHGIVAIFFLFYLINNKKESRITIFSISCIICYGLSSLHHTIPNNTILNQLDYIGIYVLIIGTYLSIFNNHVLIFFAILLSTIFSIIQIYNNAVYPIGYIIIGWLSIFGFMEILEKISTKDLTFLILGGILFTVGQYINSTKLDWAHEVFHIFVIFGTLCHLKTISGKNRMDEKPFDNYPTYLYGSRVPIGRG